jgi:lysozyme
MKPRRRVSRAAIELISRFEGYRPKAAQLPDGRWMIGYGHTHTAREGAQVSEDDAEALLLYDLIAISHALNEWIYAPLTQNQFDALASFAFNVGLEPFRRSQVLRRLNEGALIQAACAMELWRKAEFAGERIIVDALVRRRASEKALFLTPDDGWPAAPTPVLTPLPDAELEALVPNEAPAPVTATLDEEDVLVLRADEPTPPPVPPEEEGVSPVQAAAEAVASRLQTIFAEPASEPEHEPEPEVETEAETEASPEPDQPPESLAEDDTPRPEDYFSLEPPPEDFAPIEDEAEPVMAYDEGPPSTDLFEASSAANDLAEAEEPPMLDAPTAAFSQTLPPQARVVIDDIAPPPYEPAPVTEPVRTGAGPVSLAILGALGLAFFGGGVFWALNARPAPAFGPFSPLLVGWLAGMAGVGFTAVAVYLALQRLGQPAGARRRRRSY